MALILQTRWIVSLGSVGMLWASWHDGARAQPHGFRMVHGLHEALCICRSCILPLSSILQPQQPSTGAVVVPACPAAQHPHILGASDFPLCSACMAVQSRGRATERWLFSCGHSGVLEWRAVCYGRHLQSRRSEFLCALIQAGMSTGRAGGDALAHTRYLWDAFVIFWR